MPIFNQSQRQIDTPKYRQFQLDFFYHLQIVQMINNIFLIAIIIIISENEEISK